MDREHLLSLSKEELVDRLLAASASASAPLASPPSMGQRKAKKAKTRAFDMSQHTVGQVALKVAYLGWNYYGFASQAIDEATVPTIEAELFRALHTTCLISPELARPPNYSRCGRTDKGVSAFGQVVSLQLRTSPADLDYAQMLNRVLPKEIRVVGYAHVDKHFNARYACLYRGYRYFFVRERLNIEAMRTAAQYYVGEHDFRHFCKLDHASAGSGPGMSFRRRVLGVQILPVSELQASPTVPELQLYEVRVQGFAFLWHQVRCMVAVLFLVGRSTEAPEIVRELLDVATHPGRPAYQLASEAPLVLHECAFEDLQWTHRPEAMRYLEDAFAEQWRNHALHAAVVLCFSRSLATLPVALASTEKPRPWSEMAPSVRTVEEQRERERYVPLWKRKIEENFEERLKKAAEKKQKQQIEPRRAEEDE